MAESSSSSTAHRWKYDVFLSFRDADTRKGITSDLYHRLQRMGIKAFMDDSDLEVGDPISPTRLKAIEDSRFAIVVLSPNYASSTWCLEELTKICECMKDHNRILPLFYNVEPSHVRFLKRSFGEAFDKHESSGRHSSDKVQQWKDALNKVANLSGWDANNYKTDRELVDAIVDFVCTKLPPFDTEITMSMGHFGAFEATRNAVGVYGMGRVGKTTMVQHVGEEARKKGIFKDDLGLVEDIVESVYSKLQPVVVSQSPDLTKIQGRFAGLTGACTITDWEKGDFLGSGSLGSVYEGISDDGLFIAVKEVSFLDQESLGRLRVSQLEQEIALLSQFEHENIVQYYGTQKDESKLYIFLELVTKGSLQKLYYTNTLTDSHVSVYTRQILQGLKYLHDQNVIHGDIKCANILVHANGSTKLADFGLSKTLKLNDLKSCQGTVRWMAPEVVNRKSQDYGLPADIWSLGCTVLELLTGVVPYSNLEWMQACWKIGKGEPPLVPNSLSIEAQNFIHLCLKLKPDDRPTAAQLLKHPFVNKSLPPTSSGSVSMYNHHRHCYASMPRKTAASLPLSVESSSSSTRLWIYDVFLSFRGEDTRRGFTSHLYSQLLERGITTFMYNQVGNDVFPTLLEAIEGSRFAIVVLSQNYAYSAWCLDELTKIHEFMESFDRVLPVFYDVKPGDVRDQKGSFIDAFNKHERSGRYEPEKVQMWRNALRRTANLAGWDARNCRTERGLVESIVEYVCSKVESIKTNTGGFEVFEATKRAMDEVMKALEDEEITAVGVYGMGGVGKTVMVEHVCAEVQNNGMFHHVITAVVSRSPDLRKIQGTLADILGFILEEETEIGRSRRLMQRIRRGNRILIILDDIWEGIDLSNIGIPSYHELQRCNSKVLLTTRTLKVCRAMECQSDICLNVLSEEDSWTLFASRARMSFESANFYDVARKIARECAGLPISLITVAKALSDKCLEDWKEAARRLKTSLPSNPEDGNLFSCIKLSYDYLTSDDARSCLLLCCLFPEDYDIQIEDLLKYGIGKGLFQDSNTMQDARASAHSVIKYLRDCNLLLETERDGYVKMHDVTRDVAILISEDDQLFFVKAGCQLKEWPRMRTEGGYSAISLIMNQICKVPKLVCPKLVILLMQSNVHLDEIPENFFLGLNILRVLDLSRTRLSLLPTSLNLLMNFHTLYLDGCLSIIKNISILGSLKKLEILSMRDLPLVELPKEIGNLNNLRMLDITGDYVDIVPSEVICKLHRLEELYMQCNFADWRIKVGRNEVNESKVEQAGEENIVAFDELTNLSCLNILKVFICDTKCLPKNIEVEPKWFNFDIGISRNPSIRKVSLVSSSSPVCTRALTLDITINALPGWFINVVTRKAEKLQYIMCWGLDDILVEYDRGRLYALKYLSVTGPNENLKVLMDTNKRVRNDPVFQNLEELHIIQVDCLKELCVGELPSGSLCNLRLLKVKHCYQLVDALLPSQLLQRLQNLEKLICEEVDEMEYVFEYGGLKPEHIIFTGLKEMRLENLGKLLKIWNGPAPCAIFQNLQNLVVSRCFELVNLFTADVAQHLSQLEDLAVELCPLLDRVIKASAIVSKIVFPKLKNLALIKLPQLTRFYGNTGSAIECPLLEYMYVERCPQFSTTDFCSRNKVQFNHQRHLDIVQRRLKNFTSGPAPLASRKMNLIAQTEEKRMRLNNLDPTRGGSSKGHSSNHISGFPIGSLEDSSLLGDDIIGSTSFRDDDVKTVTGLSASETQSES